MISTGLRISVLFTLLTISFPPDTTRQPSSLLMLSSSEDFTTAAAEVFRLRFPEVLEARAVEKTGFFGGGTMEAETSSTLSRSSLGLSGRVIWPAFWVPEESSSGFLSFKERTSKLT